MPVPEYESLYGVSLLDDIHNYYPAFLYEPSSFLTVQQALLYVQAQTRRHFDLFSRGQQSYQRMQRAAAPPSFQARGATFYADTDVRHRFNEPGNIHTRVMRNISTPDDLLNFFTAFLGAPTSFSNVVVRPNAEQITSATTISRVETASSDICAICQDGYGIGNERRQLNVCHHIFHRGCIDTWFQENVHCPVCRHDIREPATTTTTPS